VSIPDYARGYEGFGGRVGRTFGESRPWWPGERRPRGGAPNVVVVLVDDLGYSDIGPYGSEVDTPNLDRLAESGLRLTNYHTTPLCSPSRAALLTGLNPHRAGFAVPANSDPGYPAYSFELPDDAPTLAESLRGNGYATFAVGKWHLTRDALTHDAADKASWPIQRGFDRYFGSLEGLTNLHHPHRLVWDNSPYDPGEYPEGYFLTDELTDRAVGMIDTLRANDPDKPFFLYFAHHGVHGPLAAKDADLAKYEGRYRAGWDAIRAQRFARQVAAGLFPPDTALPPRNSEPGKDVPPWDELPAERRELFARHMQVYAAAVDSVDQSLGQLVAALERHGELDNTIIVFTSDNGATAEGGAEGTRSYFSQFAHVPGLPAEWERDVPRDLQLLGGPQSTVHYPRGWAMASNTPFRLYKFDTFAGGIRTPFLVHWPTGLSDVEGQLRHQYVYVTDVAPTLLELAGVPRALQRQGIPAAEVDGVSAAAVLKQDAPSRHTRQYTETGGNRGYFADGWKIVTRHVPGTPFRDEEWELYHIETDPTETRNVAAEHPDVLARLAAEWERTAWRNTVFPLNDGSPAAGLRRPDERRLEQPVTLFPGTPTLERYRSSRLVQFRDFTVTAHLSFTPGDRGVLFAHGDQGGGYVVYVDDDAAHLVYNAYGRVHRADPVLVTGAEIRLVAHALPEFRWEFRLAAGEQESKLGPVPQLLGMAPFTGISVGADRGGPVDWALHRRERSFPYNGKLDWVRYEPGAQADYDPAQVARLWAEAERVYD
jgi:arylsulfatase A-like enzyme